MSDVIDIKHQGELFEKLKSLKEEFKDINIKLDPLIEKSKSEKISKEEYEKMVEYDKRLREISNEQTEIRNQIIEMYE